MPAPDTMPSRSGAGVFADSGQCDRLLAGIVSWITANLASFEPPQENTILEGAPEQVLPGAQRKAFGELGLALLVTGRVDRLRSTAWYSALKDFWLAQARERQIFFDLKRRVHLLPLMAVALAVSEGLGEPRPVIRRAMQSVLRRGFLDRTERAPHPTVDLKFYLDKSGIRHGFDNDDALAARSTLAGPAALPYAQRMDLYAVTHLVFHLTDFGLKDMHPLLGPRRRALCDYVALAMATMYAEGDIDLAAELLITRICLGDAADAMSRACATAICALQQADGCIPDRSAAHDASNGKHAAQVATAFSAVYHPTLVVLILIACAMQDPAADDCHG